MNRRFRSFYHIALIAGVLTFSACSPHIASKPGLPDASTRPNASGAPTASTSPDASGAPTASTTPDASGAPDASTSPGASGAPLHSAAAKATGEPAGKLQAQDQILQAQSFRSEKVEVLFSARVQKLLPDDTRGLPHQRFLVELKNGSTVLIAHDTRYAERAPVQVGDIVTINGEYIWNQRGGVVHWTHRSDTPRHEGGYIDLSGSRYQ